MPRKIIIPSDPAKDRTHPDSKLPVQTPGDIVLRLVRKFGLARGMKTFGFLMALAGGEHQDIKRLLDRRIQFEYLSELRAVGVVPDDLNPSDLGEWTRATFGPAVKTGMLLARLANPTLSGDDKAVITD